MISKDINLAKDILNDHGIIGLPTETVYGLAAKYNDEVAIKKIFELKKRPLNNPLIIHISKIDDLNLVAENIPSKVYELTSKFWPGPLTIILKKKKDISNLVTANQDTVAVRMPNHAMALEIINKLGCPIVAPSANPYMAVSSTSARHVQKYFESQLPIIIDGGNCLKGIESTIIGFEENKIIIYRKGSITREMIEKITNCEVEYYESKHNNITTPGMHKKHYSPKTPLILTDDLESELKKYEKKNIGVISFGEKKDIQNNFVLSQNKNLEEAAFNLYQTFIELDCLGFDLLIIEKMPEEGIGISINDRIKRASIN